MDVHRHLACVHFVELINIEHIDRGDRKYVGLDLNLRFRGRVVRRDYFGKVYRTSLQIVQARRH